jgi:GNAT superfamily N-acetyltransferase
MNIVEYEARTSIGECVGVELVWDDFGKKLICLVEVGHLLVGAGRIEYDQDNGKFWLAVEVIDRFQGKGIGSLIVSEMCALAELNEQVTDVWLTCPEDLVTFYSRAGFRTTEQAPEGVKFKGGQILMCKLDDRNIR